MVRYRGKAPPRRCPHKAGSCGWGVKPWHHQPSMKPSTGRAAVLTLPQSLGKWWCSVHPKRLKPLKRATWGSSRTWVRPGCVLLTSMENRETLLKASEGWQARQMGKNTRGFDQIHPNYSKTMNFDQVISMEISGVMDIPKAWMWSTGKIHIFGDPTLWYCNYFELINFGEPTHYRLCWSQRLRWRIVGCSWTTLSWTWDDLVG